MATRGQWGAIPLSIHFAPIPLVPVTFMVKLILAVIRRLDVAAAKLSSVSWQLFAIQIMQPPDPEAFGLTKREIEFFERSIPKSDWLPGVFAAKTISYQHQGGKQWSLTLLSHHFLNKLGCTGWIFFG